MVSVKFKIPIDLFQRPDHLRGIPVLLANPAVRFLTAALADQL
jgi:hypothetical protein